MIIGDASGLLGGHLWHIVIFGSWAPIFGLTLLVQRLRARPARDKSFVDEQVLAPGEGRRSGTIYCQTMALTLACAAGVHLAVLPDHFQQSPWYGTFFLVAGSGQLGAAVLLVFRPSRAFIDAAIAGSVFMVVAWLVSRTAGVPIGPDNGATEPFGVLDVLASVAEGACVVAGLKARRARLDGPVWRLSSWPVLLRFAVPLCVLGTIVADTLASHS